MIELGKIQELVIHRLAPQGAYIGEADNQDSKRDILLPRKQVPEGSKPGDSVTAFVYRDSEDRLIATVHKPMMQVGEIARLQVVSVSEIGAFLDWGLERDLFLPFKQQTSKVHPGDWCVVRLYVDRSQRLCATMKIYEQLSTDSPYQVGDAVTGLIYQVNDRLGALVAVDLKYHGLIPTRELFGKHMVGEEITGRVVKIREDGKLNLSIREKAYLQMDKDAELVLNRIRERGGVLPFTDKAAPLVINQEFGLSKNAFKRAVGRLLKNHQILLEGNSIKLIEE